MFGGQVGIGGHINIGKGVQAGGRDARSAGRILGQDREDYGDAADGGQPYACRGSPVETPSIRISTVSPSWLSCETSYQRM